MPSLPPFFNGKINGVLTISISDISWFKNDIKSTFVQFEWTGSHEKHKLLTTKYSKITYDIRTSYKSFINYLSTCILKCSVKSNEYKSFVYATIKNISISPNIQLVKTLPLMKNEKTVGTLKLCFDLQTFNDTSFDNDIKSLKNNGILSEFLNPANDKELYYLELFKPTKCVRPVSSLSIETNKSKEELTSNYLMGKDMAPEEEEEALNTLRLMPSAESIVSAAEKISIYSPLHIKGNTKIMTNITPNVKNMKKIQTNLKKSCSELNNHELKTDYFKLLQKVPVPDNDVYLHLSILSINVYRTIKSLQNYTNSTYIVQCLKDQEPYKLLRFMSRHMDDNVVKFKAAILSSRLEGGTVNGITIRVNVRHLSERSPIVLGETKQMLDWTGFSTNFDNLRFIKVPIWNNDKIIGHLSLSYAFSKTPVFQKYKNYNSVKNVENIEYSEIQPSVLNTANISKSVSAINRSTDFEDKTMYQMKNEIYNRFYPRQFNESNTENQLFLDERSNKEPNKVLKEKETLLVLDEQPNKKSAKVKKEKETQTNIQVRQLNKSIQTLVKTFNVAIQVDSDELEDPLDKSTCCDVQNIFRCTHEFTLHIEKKYNSTFNYVTYHFPECVTTNTGKVITCHRMLRTFGNTNILHLITLPTTISLEYYFYNYFKRSAIVLNLHQNNDYLPRKISLLVSHMIEMADKFKNSHITKNLILNNKSSMHELPSDNVVYIKIHYKRIYHTFPPSDKQFKNTCSSHKSLKRNSKNIVDLTESDSDETSINKTYTLFKHDDKLNDPSAENSTQTDPLPVKISHNNTTQTEKDVKEQYTHGSCNSTKNKSENNKQISTTVVVENLSNQINTKSREFNYIIDTFDENDIFKAKVNIVGGYNLPMVKLNGDITPSAPTSYVILDNFVGSSLSTSSVVQKVNPVWNSEWTLILPKNKLIEGKWLILELWCKKYRNEYAGHDAKRDKRLGFIFINVCALEYKLNQAGGLYDVISETEEHYGKIKVIFSLIKNNNPKINVNYKSEPMNESTIDKTTEKNTEKSNNRLINEKKGRLQTENNYIDTRKYENDMIVRNEKHEYVDLTEDSPQKCNTTSLKNVFSESCLKNKFINNDNQSTMETISSVTSWTSSSDDILCSNNNFQTVNSILCNETKMNRIKQIIQG